MHDPPRRRFGVKSVASQIARGTGFLLAVTIAICFFFYPFFFTWSLIADHSLRAEGQPSALPSWFRRTARRYDRWALDYLETHHAATVHEADVAATEWPMFGSVFLLLTAEELIDDGKVGLDPELRSTLDRAARVISDPSTATWVRRKWGSEYLERENVFYRMLLLLGLSSYERITTDRTHHALIVDQAAKLARELDEAPYHLADDYPGECYPTDVLWAVVAIQRAGALDGQRYSELGAKVLRVLDGPFRTEHGLPAFQVNSRTGDVYQPARGSANSGILSLAGELDANTAARWYESYLEHYWTDGFIRGFRELPRGAPSMMDVDSGPVVLDVGSVATAFGIGAARAAGRFDQAALLTLETMTTAWPTPFGLLLPGILGFAAADGWCFGELALHFAMTRPNYSGKVTTGERDVPPLVWLLQGFYLGFGVLILYREASYWRRRRRTRDDPGRHAFKVTKQTNEGSTG